jgi:drug/metabolite transporter (DMT)-like permease
LTSFHSHRAGVLLTLLSAALWSTAGVFVRMADTDVWTLVAWRSIFAALALWMLVAYRRRDQATRRPFRLGSVELVPIAIAVISTVAYMACLQLTTVANVMTVYAALPFLATGIAYAWLRERVTRRFVIAGSVALVAIAAMAGGVATRRDVLGVTIALVMTTGFAIQLVHAKRHPTLDITWVIAIAATLCVPLALPFAAPGLPPLRVVTACALSGVLTTAVAFLLALKGGRLIPSGEAGLLSLLDVPLGPLWVWLLFAERPQPIALVSGSVVLLAVVWYLLGSGRAQAMTAGADPSRPSPHGARPGAPPAIEREGGWQ